MNHAVVVATVRKPLIRSWRGDEGVRKRKWSKNTNCLEFLPKPIRFSKAAPEKAIQFTKVWFESPFTPFKHYIFLLKIKISPPTHVQVRPKAHIGTDHTNTARKTVEVMRTVSKVRNYHKISHVHWRSLQKGQRTTLVYFDALGLREYHIKCRVYQKTAFNILGLRPAQEFRSGSDSKILTSIGNV